MKYRLKYGLLASVFMLGACSDKDVPVSDIPSAICPSSITFDLPESLSQLIYQDATGANCLPLLKGETVTLDYTLEPENITFDDVIWTSTNPEAVTVDRGNVTAISGDGLGYSVVQVAPEGMYSGSGVNCNLKVVVSNEMVKAESISLTAPALTVYAGESLQLAAQVYPDNATYKTVQWQSTDETIATVNAQGVVTGMPSEIVNQTVSILAVALDGSNVYASIDVEVKQVVPAQQIVLDQQFASPNYYCAINEKQLALQYTTVPEECTLSTIEWTSSDESIATVNEGVVTFNQEGVFGDVTITAICKETGETSTINLTIPAGLVRELYHDKDNYSWYNAKQSGNGTSSSHEWHDGYVTVTTYTQNATKQRGDFKCWSPKTWLHAGEYPIFAIRMDDVRDMYAGVTARNITFDAVGKCKDADYKGGLDGNNNKWLHDYKCSDGSHVFIYNLATQKWATGGALPTDAVATFTSMQFKYADIATLTEQVTYNVYWVQTFKSIEALQEYVTEVEGLTYDVIK